MSKASKLRLELHGKKFKYSTKKYPFKKILEELFGVPLYSIHEWLGEYKTFNKYNDQSTLAHKVFYANFNKHFKFIFDDFIANEVSDLITLPFHYQLIPTFRLGLPGNKFVGEFHKDSNYNHQDYEINFNLGLENYIGEASLKTQLNPKSDNYIFLECPYGYLFSFNHIDCLHGSEVNRTNKTMVSFDFRLALKEEYSDSKAKSITNNTKFNIGSYFSKKCIND